MEIIGEAVKRLSPLLCQKFPDVPWKTMAGMRDRLIHGYDRVELDVVFEAGTEVIPGLIPRLEAIMSTVPDPE